MFKLIMFLSFLALLSTSNADSGFKEVRPEAIYGGFVASITSAYFQDASYIPAAPLDVLTAPFSSGMQYALVFFTTESSKTGWIGAIGNLTGDDPIAPWENNPWNSSFVPVPGMQDSDGLGGNVKNIAISSTAKSLFFAKADGVSVQQIYLGQLGVSSMSQSEIIGSSEGWTKVWPMTTSIGQLTGTIPDDSRLLIAGSTSILGEIEIMVFDYRSSPSTKSKTSFNVGANPEDVRILIGRDGYIRVMVLTTVVQIYKSSNQLDSFSSSTTFSLYDSVSSCSTTSGGWSGSFENGKPTAYGIGLDGRLFIAGRQSSSHESAIAYSDSVGVWNCHGTSGGHIAGSNLLVSADPTNSSNYGVWFSSYVSKSRGDAGTFETIPTTITPAPSPRSQTHINDGAINIIPYVDSSLLLLTTTDLAMGFSPKGGDVLYDLSNGLTTVAFLGLAVTQDKRIAWTASKSGVRWTGNYNDSNPSWTLPLWPDGAPTYGVAIDEINDATGQSVFLSNQRLYATQDGGLSWWIILDLNSVSTPVGIQNTGIISKMLLLNSSIMIAGSQVTHQDQNPSVGTTGSLFWTTSRRGSRGTLPTWTQVSTGASKVKVTDLYSIQNGTSYKIYVCNAYTTVPSLSADSFGVGMVEYDSITDTWGTYDSTMGTIDATKFSCGGLAMGSDNILYAFGEEYASISPVMKNPAIYKLEGGVWSKMSIVGLPGGFGGASGGAGSVWNAPITVGISAGTSFPIIAIQNVVYGYNGTWFVMETFANGMQIKVLLWDELIVATGAGLYSYRGAYEKKIIGGNTTTQRVSTVQSTVVKSTVVKSTVVKSTVVKSTAKSTVKTSSTRRSTTTKKLTTTTTTTKRLVSTSKKTSTKTTRKTSSSRTTKRTTKWSSSTRKTTTTRTTKK